jgi:hypothetical protein
MKKTHNPQKSITILLIWMMYARKKNTKRERGYASCEMSGRANRKLEKL